MRRKIRVSGINSNSRRPKWCQPRGTHGRFPRKARARFVVLTNVLGLSKTTLFHHEWVVDGLGAVRLEALGSTEAINLATVWAVREAPWSWGHVWKHHEPEVYVLRNLATGHPVAAWASRRKLLTVLGTPSYHLSFLEVCPKLCGSGTAGAFAFAVLCARALELGASALILQCPQERARFYELLGGRKGEIRGWQPDRNLLTFQFDQVTLTKHKETERAFRN
jgi:hypothetical protein